MASVGELAHKVLGRIVTDYDPAGVTVPFVTDPPLRPKLDPSDTGLIYDLTTSSLLEWAGAWWVEPGKTDPVETLAFPQVLPRLDGAPRAGQPIACHPGTWAGSPAPSIEFTWSIEGEELNPALANSTSRFGRNADELAAMQSGREIRCLVRATQTLTSGVLVRTARASAYIQPALTGGA